MSPTFIGMAAIVLALIPVSVTIIYSVKKIEKEGFTCITTALLIMILFYIIVPIGVIASKADINTQNAINTLLVSGQFEDLCITILLCSGMISLFLISYLIKFRNGVLLFNNNVLDKNVISPRDWEKVNLGSRKVVSIIADASLIFGAVSMLIVITSVGGIKAYLVLGNVARGIDKDVEAYISSSKLLFITLSGVILASPYLYRYLSLSDNKSIWNKIKFFVSLALSILYLLYNQGRLPILLFFVPFILNLKSTRKAKISTLILLTVGSILLLEPMNYLFKYLMNRRVTEITYSGIWDVFFLEFSYPFTNVMNRSRLVEFFGFRSGLDYIQWPLTLIPSSALKVFGIDKKMIQWIGELNTESYYQLTGIKKGGVPTDFFTFNYYQFGIFSMLLSIPFFAGILRAIDKRILYLKSNEATQILALRLCFLLVSMVNNFDIGVIFRTRSDFIILSIVMFYLMEKGMKIAEAEQKESVPANELPMNPNPKLVWSKVK